MDDAGLVSAWSSVAGDDARGEGIDFFRFIGGEKSQFRGSGSLCGIAGVTRGGE